MELKPRTKSINSSILKDQIVQPLPLLGRGKLYTDGKLILYHRGEDCCEERINGSTVQFFNGDY